MKTIQLDLFIKPKRTPNNWDYKWNRRWLKEQIFELVKMNNTEYWITSNKIKKKWTLTNK